LGLFPSGISLFYRLLFDFRRRELHIVRLVLAIYALGFSYGTRNHILDIMADGFLGYHYVSFPINLFWTSLTFLDPLAVILLLTYPLYGLALSILIMASDIAVNVSVTLYFYFLNGIPSNGRLLLQIAFGIFVFLTAPIAWKRIKTYPHA